MQTSKELHKHAIPVVMVAFALIAFSAATVTSLTVVAGYQGKSVSLFDALTGQTTSPQSGSFLDVIGSNMSESGAKIPGIALNAGSGLGDQLKNVDLGTTTMQLINMRAALEKAQLPVTKTTKH